MTINASNEFNKQPRSMGALGRSFTLGRKPSQNKFTLNPQNDLPIGKAETILNGMATLTRRKKDPHNAYKYSVDTLLVGDSSRNRPKSLWAATLRKIKRSSQTPQVESKPNSLEEAKKLFWDEDNNKSFDTFNLSDKTAESSYFSPGNKRSSLTGSLRRAKTFLINLKKPEEIHEYLNKAKMFFQNSEYKEAKKNFNKFLSSKHVDASGKKPEIYLYLTAICLLQGDGKEAEGYSKELKDPYLRLLMGNHSAHLSDPKKKDIPFPQASFYIFENKSEDRKIILEKLSEAFILKDSTQNN